MLGVRLLGMELRPPPASLGGRERLHRARFARREDAKPLGQDSDLIGVILEDDGVFGQVAQQVAAIVDPDREESVLDALSDVDRPSCKPRQELHPSADAERRSFRRAHGFAEHLELGGITHRPGSSSIR